MAQVPYDPVPQGAPGPLPTEGPRVDLPGALLAPAQATERAGQQVGQAGNELFQTALQIQNLRNENTARQAGIAATGEMSDIFSKYDSLDGHARADAFPKMRADMEAVRQKYRANLNPMAAKMFDQDAANLQNRFTSIGALRAGEGIKQQAQDISKAKVKQLQEMPVDIPGDKAELIARSNKLADEIDLRRQPDRGNWTEEQIQVAKEEEVSRLWTTQIGAVAPYDTEKGWDLQTFARARGMLTQPDIDTTTKVLRAQTKLVTADQLAKGIVDRVSKQGGLVDDMDKEAEKIAPDYSHGDPEFITAMYDRIRHWNNQRTYSVQNEKNETKLGIAGLFESGAVKTYDDLRADPRGAQLIQNAVRLDPTYALSLPKKIEKWNSDKNIKEKLNRVHELTTMADDEPDKLMAIDPMDEFDTLGKDGVKAVWALQRHLKAEGRLDPRLNQAYSDLAAQYPNEVPQRTIDPEGYQQYKGALYQALQVRQGMEMKPITPEDYKNIHHMLMQQVTNSRFAGLWSTNTPMYKMDIPPEFAELAREKDPNISEDEIRNNWFAGQSLYFFNRLHGRAREGLTKPRPRIEAGTPPPAITPASAPTPLPPTSPVNIRGRPLTGEDIQKVSEDVQKGLKALSKAKAEPGSEAAGLTEGPTAAAPIKRRSPGEEIH